MKLKNGVLIRSRITQIESNENPTSFFFQAERSSANKNHVKSLTVDGYTLTSNEDMVNAFKEFDSQLYQEETVENSCMNPFLSDLLQVSSYFNEILASLISKSEIFEVLKHMNPNGSPGRDGLSTLFYITFFDVFGNLLVSLFTMCFDEGEMCPSQKLSYIIGQFHF